VESARPRRHSWSAFAQAGELVVLEVALKSEREQRRSLQEVLEQARAELEALSAAANARIQELEERITALEDENDALDEALQAERNEHEETTTRAQRATTFHAEELQRLSARAEELQEKLEAQCSEERWRTGMEEEESGRASLRSGQKISLLEQEVALLTSKLRISRSEVELLTTNLENLEARLAAARQVTVGMEQERTTLRGQLSITEDALEDTEERCGQLEAGNASLRAQLCRGTVGVPLRAEICSFSRNTSECSLATENRKGPPRLEVIESPTSRWRKSGRAQRELERVQLELGQADGDKPTAEQELERVQREMGLLVTAELDMLGNSDPNLTLLMSKARAGGLFNTLEAFRGGTPRSCGPRLRSPRSGLSPRITRRNLVVCI